MSSLRHASQDSANLVIRNVRARDNMRISGHTKQRIHNKLRRVIPGVRKGISLGDLDIKLKKEQSNADMKSLMSMFDYPKILAVAKDLVDRGLFNHGFKLSPSNVEKPSSSELVSSIVEESSSTDPISGVFGRLKLWYGA
jgi:hypothetical protein